MKIHLFVIFIFSSLVFFGVGLITGLNNGRKMGMKKRTHKSTNDLWYKIGTRKNGAEWRHINSPDDTMAVVHIYQNNEVYTWVGKPCNCY